MNLFEFREGIMAEVWYGRGLALQCLQTLQETSHIHAACMDMLELEQSSLMWCTSCGSAARVWHKE